MASPATENVSRNEIVTMDETNVGKSGKLAGVESELELMTFSDELSSSLLDASLSEYQ
jgi:hypothetical protein